MSTKIVGRHAFAAGAAYARHEAASPQEYLDAVLEAERYLDSAKQVTEDGIYWNLDPQKPADLSFYGGSAGVVYFYLKLAQSLGRAQDRKKAQEGTRYLTAHWKEFLEGDPLLPFPGTETGLYFGIGGIGLILAEAWEVLGDEAAASAAKAIGEYYGEKASRDEQGVYWQGSTALAFDGGVILFLLRLQELFPTGDRKDLIRSAGEHYLSKGIPHEDGSLEYNGFAGFVPISLPNFEFGTSGSGYLLLKLYQFTGEETYLEAARKAEQYIRGLLIPQEKGVLVPYRQYDGEGPIFYLSTCHGPAGTAKFFWLLYQITGDEKALTLIGELVDGIEALGAPERQSTGYWNNVCLCCGAAGLAQFFVCLYQATGQERYLDLAVRSGNVLLGEKETQGDRAYWPLAWTRVEPEKITQPIGYYDGAAGIAAALLQLYLAQTGTYSWKKLIDDPFPER